MVKRVLYPLRGGFPECLDKRKGNKRKGSLVKKFSEEGADKTGTLDLPLRDGVVDLSDASRSAFLPLSSRGTSTFLVVAQKAVHAQILARGELDRDQ